MGRFLQTNLPRDQTTRFGDSHLLSATERHLKHFGVRHREAERGRDAASPCVDGGQRERMHLSRSKTEWPFWGKREKYVKKDSDSEKQFDQTQTKTTWGVSPLNLLVETLPPGLPGRPSWTADNGFSILEEQKRNQSLGIVIKTSYEFRRSENPFLHSRLTCASSRCPHLCRDWAVAWCKWAKPLFHWAEASWKDPDWACWGSAVGVLGCTGPRSEQKFHSWFLEQELGDSENQSVGLLYIYKKVKNKIKKDVFLNLTAASKALLRLASS